MTFLRLFSPGGAVLAALAVAACSGGGTMATTGAATSSASSGAGTGGGGTGGGTGGGPFVPGTHAVLPQVVSLGGSVLKSPKVQAIIYASEPKAVDIDAFLQELTTTTYWSQTTAEYGVGPLTVLPTIKRKEAPPATLMDLDLQNDLFTNTSGATPTWGTADPSTIYLFILPPGTIIDAQGSCCTSFDGYHQEATAGTGSVAYGVVCSCGGMFDGPNITDVQQVTVAVSHELVEAATDPFVQNNPAFGQTDAADIVWTLGAGGEVADMCEFNANAFVIPAGGKYMVQQSWSNAAAKADKDPCVPHPSNAPYFGATAVLPDMLHVNGVTPKTKGVKLAVGMSATVDVQLFSDAPTKGPFKVTPLDFSQFSNGGSPHLELTLDKNMGNNGDTLKLTIKVLVADAMLGAEPFFLSSTLGQDESLWMGAVGN